MCEFFFFFPKSSPTCSSPPPLSYSFRRLADVMAGSCETKQFQCRLWKKVSFGFFFPFFFTIPFFWSPAYCVQLHELTACGGGDVLITGSLLIAVCTRTLRNFCSREWLWSESSTQKVPPFFISVIFFLSDFLKITPKCTICTAKSTGHCECIYLSVFLYRLIAVCLKSLPRLRILHFADIFLTLFIHGRLAVQKQLGTSAVSACTFCVEDQFAPE